MLLHDADHALRSTPLARNRLQHLLPPVHHLPFHRQRDRQVQLPVSEDIGSRCLALPLHTALGEAELDRICGALREILDRLVV
ncbi:DegT/DnrJ/EryC1/StrS family aminotransferase [Pseudomarimonas arenosa]|uniref:DegT/DnrJ/EryC1/StrS aminotransferase family protein n=1 Tax=Pseudomarimonas arenosa TaxID=2774145 RepID=A0AAW3ZPD5_9GAMM|nr:DegT/DnrJ/EryC1/StrS family aminotransferase [Pseudomarimonas arenosa]MBD8526499.1 DegT/DnrJ/EryC1/StrS aminotransferase family protein [Pseudomarimonas arenosa]